jgi:hypothetical protein
MENRSILLNWSLGLLGAVLGGVAGCFVFLWMARQGLYAIILPGAAIGLGCGLLSQGKSTGLRIFCVVLALLVGLYSEWVFSGDESLHEFLEHLYLQPIAPILIAIGAAMAYWLAVGRTPRQGPAND